MNGLSFLMDAANVYKKTYVKLQLNQRMQDQYVQSYSKSIEKYDVLSSTNLNYPYLKRKYLNEIKCPNTRHAFTALRINHNKLCAYNHKPDDNDCNHCNTYENTEHLLFHCNKDDIIPIRDKFYNNIKNVIPYFSRFTFIEQMQYILSLNCPCSMEKETSAVAITCKFVKDIFNQRFHLY